MANETNAQVVDQEIEVAAALPEITESHLVFDHAPQSSPVIAASANTRAA